MTTSPGFSVLRDFYSYLVGDESVETAGILKWFELMFSNGFDRFSDLACSGVSYSRTADRVKVMFGFVVEHGAIDMVEMFYSCVGESESDERMFHEDEIASAYAIARFFAHNIVLMRDERIEMYVVCLDAFLLYYSQNVLDIDYSFDVLDTPDR